MPKGALLVGPPGTGKTLIARAVAVEAKVPFFAISGSEFVQMFVGMGAAKVRDLFKQAGEKAPWIIFIDEIDAIGKRRDTGMGNDEREQTLNQLLTEMDGFDGRKGVVILAATNRPESLVKALLRPGRFDRRVQTELPDLEGRKAILAVHLKKVKHVDIDMDIVARAIAGSSGAELANIVNIEQATKLARAMVTRYGMSEKYDMMGLETVNNAYSGGDSSLTCSADTASDIDREVLNVIREAHDKARKIISENMEIMHKAASFLIEKVTITGDEFMKIVNDNTDGRITSPDSSIFCTPAENILSVF